MNQMESNLMIRDMEPGEAHAVSKLITEVFDRFVAPDLEPEGIDEFLGHASAAAMQVHLLNGHFILVAEVDGELVGVANVREHRHLCLFFVKTALHGKGVGKRLLQAALDRCLLKHPDLPCLTVNSSLWAVPVYKKLGFVQAEEEQLKNGIRFVPMRKDLNGSPAAAG